MAGKSTLLAAISRLLPLGEGLMRLDGWDAGSVPLRRWRQAIRAIPQVRVALMTTDDRPIAIDGH